MADILNYSRQGFMAMYPVVEADVNAGYVEFDIPDSYERDFFNIVQIRRSGVDQIGFDVDYADNVLKISNPVAVTSVADEAVGTGDGAEVTFAVTLAETPIKEGTLVVAVDGTDQSVTEADGVITASGLSGTLNKATGELSITFDTAPADTLAITADYDYFDNGLTVDDEIHLVGTLYFA